MKVELINRINVMVMDLYTAHFNNINLVNLKMIKWLDNVIKWVLIGVR